VEAFYQKTGLTGLTLNLPPQKKIRNISKTDKNPKTHRVKSSFKNLLCNPAFKSINHFLLQALGP